MDARRGRVPILERSLARSKHTEVSGNGAKKAQQRDFPYLLYPFLSFLRAFLFSGAGFGLGLRVPVQRDGAVLPEPSHVYFGPRAQVRVTRSQA